MIPPIEQYKDLIYKNANYCFVRLPNPKPYEYEDLLSIASLTYVKVKAAFDPSRGCKFITPFYQALKNEFACLLRKAYKVPPPILEDLKESNVPIDMGSYVQPESLHPTHLFTEVLSDRAQEFVALLLHPNDNLSTYLEITYKKETHNPTHKAKRILKYLGHDQNEQCNILLEVKRKFA